MNTSGFVCFCWHCGNKGLLNYIVSFDSVHEAPKNEDIKNPIICQLAGNTEITTWSVYQCPVCGNPVLISKTLPNAMPEQFAQYRYQFPTQNIDYTGVPENIKAAFESALRTRTIDSAICILSLRRTLEMICKDKGAEGRDLKSKIQNLIDKKVLPEMMNDACWIVRQSGNDAAHADNVVFTTFEVQEIIKYVTIVIEYLYSLPVRVADLKNKISKRKTQDNQQILDI